MTIDILYEDAHVLAVAKPSGQAVIPGRGALPGEPLRAELERHMGRKIYVVHRLDRGASGVVLFAKDTTTHRLLSLQFERREVRKTYLVLVLGVLEAGGRIEQPLRAFGSGRMGIDAQGKASTTEFRVREGLRGSTLLEVSPRTGRRHQIRAHLYSLGHPVMGDPLYGKERPVGGMSRLMLHAWEIEFADPDGRRRTVRADPPPDFQAGLALLRP